MESPNAQHRQHRRDQPTWQTDRDDDIDLTVATVLIIAGIRPSLVVPGSGLIVAIAGPRAHLAGCRDRLRRRFSVSAQSR